MIKNDIQYNIMLLIDNWAKENDEPILRSYIISEVKTDLINECAVIRGLNYLVKHGYIRRSVNTSNKTSYVQLGKI